MCTHAAHTCLIVFDPVQEACIVWQAKAEGLLADGVARRGTRFGRLKDSGLRVKGERALRSGIAYGSRSKGRNKAYATESLLKLSAKVFSRVRKSYSRERLRRVLRKKTSAELRLIHLHICTSTSLLIFIIFTHLHLCSSQLIFIFTHLHLCSSSHLHIYISAHLHILTSTAYSSHLHLSL